jgi:hypothetical protein
MLGYRRPDLELLTGLELRVCLANPFERTRFGAQVLGATEVEHDGSGRHSGAVCSHAGIVDHGIRIRWVHRRGAGDTPHQTLVTLRVPAHNARMPIPEPDRLDTAEVEDERRRRVAGTVRLMTDDPFEVDEDAGTGLGQLLKKIAAQKPWVIPAALLGIGVAFLVLRRR